MLWGAAEGPGLEGGGCDAVCSWAWDGGDGAQLCQPGCDWGFEARVVSWSWSAVSALLSCLTHSPLGTGPGGCSFPRKLWQRFAHHRHREKSRNGLPRLHLEVLNQVSTYIIHTYMQPPNHSLCVPVNHLKWIKCTAASWWAELG